MSSANRFNRRADVVKCRSCKDNVLRTDTFCRACGIRNPGESTLTNLIVACGLAFFIAVAAVASLLNPNREKGNSQNAELPAIERGIDAGPIAEDNKRLVDLLHTEAVPSTQPAPVGFDGTAPIDDQRTVLRPFRSEDIDDEIQTEQTDDSGNASNQKTP